MVESLTSEFSSKMLRTPGSLRIIGVVEYRLDVHDWSFINRLDRPDLQSRPGNLPHRYSMKPQWIGPVGRSGRKDSGDRNLRVAARMNLEYFATATVQPGDDDELVARSDAPERRLKDRIELEPGIRRSLRALPGRLIL